MSPFGIFGPRTGHEPLFWEVVKYHNLDRKSRNLIYSVAKKYQPERLSEVFLNPRILQLAIDDAEFVSSTDDLREIYKNWFE
ncbi:MAG: hypothetical protein ACRCUY_08580 [Thermoguttaceae bacterium]